LQNLIFGTHRFLAQLTQMAFATLRVLKKKVDVICFVTGHGESVAEGPPHFHYSHIETLRGHETPARETFCKARPTVSTGCSLG